MQFAFQSEEDAENLKLVENYYALFEKILVIQSRLEYSIKVFEYLICRLELTSNVCNLPDKYQPINAKKLVEEERLKVLRQEQKQEEEKKQQELAPNLFKTQFFIDDEKKRKQIFEEATKLETVNFTVTTDDQTLKQKVMKLDSILVQLNQQLSTLIPKNFALYKQLQKKENGQEPFVLNNDPFL